MKKIIKEKVKTQVKAQVTRILPRIKESVNAQLEAEVLSRSSRSSRTSYAVAADLSEMEIKKILIDKMEGNKSIQRSDEQRNLYKALVEAYDADKTILDTYGESTILKRRREDDDQEGPSAGSNRGPMRQPTPDRDWNKTLPATQGNTQSWISALAKQTDARSSFNELLDTPIDFSNFIMNRSEPINYDKHALWGVSHWGRKHHQFYGFVVNRESALDVYSKRRIIAVTELKIMEWHNYKHLDWISIHRDDDKIYKFKEGNFKRLCLQDIEYMLLLLVQGKLSNLTVKERFAFNVSLRMFTKSIVIQQRVEDLQLGVESYQKRLNLTKPDTYRSDLKLMRIDELYKFNDGTLNDVRNALDDRLKGIRMQYLPTTIWRKGHKDRAAAMIQAIDKMLKTRRIMRILERPPLPDRDWNKTLPAAQGDAQSWISDLARQTDAHSSFNELLDTPIDFSNFIMNWLGVATLTPELLAGPTYELMRGSCQQYPHNLLQPLPLILDNRGRRVIPFEHFINNDLEYLRGGASSHKYTTSVTKTKAADYGHIKWIEDLVPRAMWIQEPINYDRHALWGVSHWGQKRQQFYGFAVNQESALDVYSKRRIIAVTKLKIMEWHDYKHLDWISVRRDDDKIYKFKEGDYKRLRIQDIKKAISKGYASKTLKICCYSWYKGRTEVGQK
nr:hypothetical protein [Tanacetum cinerariifolium]